MFASKDINLLIKSVTPSNLFVLSVHDMAKEVYCYLLEVSMRQFFSSSLTLRTNMLSVVAPL
jgi:hypothetical protein